MTNDIVATNNGYGWTTSVPNQITNALLDWIEVSSAKSPRILDIGAGFGVGTLPMLKAGARVTALDLDATHLDVIRWEAERLGISDKLKTIADAFPGSLRFEVFDAIHCSNVLHFLSGSEIELGAMKMREWLKPGGKVFIQVGTIYAGHIKRMRPIFEQRMKSGIRWVGETDVAKEYVDFEFRNEIPSFMNFLYQEPLVGAFEAASFSIEKAWYYTRHGLPASIRSDGRENFGLIGSLSVS